MPYYCLIDFFKSIAFFGLNEDFFEAPIMIACKLTGLPFFIIIMIIITLAT